MTKHDWAWVAVKCTGLWLLVLSVCTLASSASGGTRFLVARAVIPSPTAEPEEPSPDTLSGVMGEFYETFGARALTNAAGHLIKALVLALAALYLLKRGNMVLRWMKHPEYAKPAVDP